MKKPVDLRKLPSLCAALLSLQMISLTAQAQWSGAGAGGAGTDFNNTGNWTGGTINGVFTNLNANTAVGTLSLSADYSLATGSYGLSLFNAAGAQSSTVTLNGSGGVRMLTLGGNVTINKASSSAGVNGTVNLVTLGSNLTLDLNAATPSVSFAGSGAGTAMLTINGLVQNGGFSGTLSGCTINLLNSANSFSSLSLVGSQNGTTIFNSIGNKNINSALGAGSVAAPQIKINNTTLTMSGAAANQSSDRDIQIVNQGLVKNNDSTYALSLTGTVQGDYGTSVPGTFRLGGSNTGNNICSGYMADGTFISPATLSLEKDDAGNWTVNNDTNSFSGTVYVTSGSLFYTSIGNKGTNSALGNGLGSTVDWQVSANNSTLALTGAAANQSSDRDFRIINSGRIKNNDSTHTLTLSGTIKSYSGVSGQANGTVRLGGSNTGTNTCSALLADGGFFYNLSLGKDDAGVWTVNNDNNSFTGSASCNAGTLNFSSLANKGVNCAFGVGTGTAPQVSVNNGTIAMTGATGTQSSDRDIEVVNTAKIKNNDANYALNLTGTIKSYYQSGANGNLNLCGTNTLDNTCSALLANNTSSTFSLGKDDSGKWIVNGANTFTGTASVLAGILQVNSINSIGGAHQATSSLGAPTTVGNGTINIGANSPAATLRYTGPGETTDRVINIASLFNYGGGILDASGTGPLVFSSALTLNNLATGTRTLTLQGTNTAANTLSGGGIGDGTTGTANLSVTKADTGIWVISGNNTYSGGTAINGGVLQINGQVSPNSGTGTGAVAVNIGGTLSGNGRIGGPVTVNVGGTLSPGSNSIGTLTIASNLTLAGNVFIEVNKSVSPSNGLTVVSGTITNAGTGTVTVTNLGGVALALGNTFKIFSQAVSNGAALTITGGNLPANTVWANNLATDGSIAVVTATPSSPGYLQFVVTGGGSGMTLSWTNASAVLQSQTNTLSVGLGTNWVDRPGASPVNVTNNPANGAVFYRLRQ